MIPGATRPALGELERAPLAEGAVEDAGAMAEPRRAGQLSAHHPRRAGAIQSTDVVLPTATLPRRELHLRCVVRPDRAQAALLQRLGLRLPERLPMPTGARQM